MSVREAEKLVTSTTKEVPATKARAANDGGRDTRRLEEELSDLLSASVKIKLGGRGRGKLPSISATWIRSKAFWPPARQRRHNARLSALSSTKVTRTHRDECARTRVGARQQGARARDSRGRVLGCSFCIRARGLHCPRLIDWQTVLTLAGLLMVTKAVELSGFLMWMAHRVVHRIHSERALAFLLIGLAAVLSTLLTNDVALFAVVPLVLSLHKLAPLPIKRLVIFIALAVNAGSILTPLGNPQNLFLWQDERRLFRSVRLGARAAVRRVDGDVKLQR